MEADDHFSEILGALCVAKVEFIVAGGVAVVLQGVERATMDLDLSIRMKTDNISRFLWVMKNLGLVPRVPLPADVLLNADQRKRMVSEKGALVFTFVHPDKPFQQVDIFLTPLLDFENLNDESETIDIDGVQTKLLSKRQLIALKKMIDPPRDKDLFDIASLEKLLASNEPKKR